VRGYELLDYLGRHCGFEDSTSLSTFTYWRRLLAEVREQGACSRVYLPRTRVNRGKRKGGSVGLAFRKPDPTCSRLGTSHSS
jgi:hypothetical protein